MTYIILLKEHPLQAFGIADFHLPQLILPPVERHFRDVRLPAHLQDRPTSVGLPQNRDLILYAVLLAFIRLVPFGPDYPSTRKGGVTSGRRVEPLTSSAGLPS